MSDAPAGEAPPPAAPRLLSLWVTALCSAALLGLGTWLLAPGDPLQALDRPLESLEQVVGREMDLRAALGRAAPWERALYGLALAPDEVARDDAIRWYDELVEAENSPLAALHRSVLLAEDGRTERLAAELDDWAATGAGGEPFAAWARAAYGTGAPPPAEAPATRGELRASLGAGWFADRLLARLAERAGDAAGVAAAEAATLARGARLLTRYRLLLLAEALLIGLGLAALAWRRAGVRVGEARLPPAWGGADGAGLFVRGAIGLVAVGIAWGFVPEGQPWLAAGLSVVSGLPLLAYVAWYLRRRGLPVLRTLGLRVAPAGGPALVRMTLVLIGVSTLLDVIVEVGAGLLGVGSHWADGFMEGLLWGPPGRVLAESADAVLWAPLVEEPLFRGVLYPTLRVRAGPWTAGLASATLFAAAHGYGTVGFASVLGSGLLWAWAYERTRSLLPVMLAHAVANLVATAIFLVSLRW